jgi:hypothetical protein
MSNHPDAWEQVLAKVLLYEANEHLKFGLTALGIKNITYFVLMEVQDFKGLDYIFYLVGESRMIQQ